ncbi:unnamed protein product [Prorocentrum cordatum]|uniref:Glycosyl transferase CAP10 domain-containing protein n=1 Tax=Prorocentrum cordatum TaxID=2364126 RepID=A0ABN9PS29_9DINO|nr:unnamed protein product [Polarella glacialis]
MLEQQIAEGQAAFSASLGAMDELLTVSRSQELSTRPREISAICQIFSLSSQSCKRVPEYLGRLATIKERMTVKVYEIKNTTLHCDSLFAIGILDLCNVHADTAAEVYRNDICNALMPSKQHMSHTLQGTHGARYLSHARALFKFGDRRDASACHPTFYKTRLTSKRDDNYVLLDLNHARHWGVMAAVPSYDIPWGSKSARVVWRGVSTGKCSATAVNSRMMLCDRWFRSSDARIDVGMTSIVQGCGEAKKFVKPGMSMKGMLQSKYILVVNGNDKASGLNWALLSNSVPFMVEPDVESWLLESNLKAWVHYIPVKPDFSDLSSQVDWAVENDSEAERIAKAGKEYVRQFGSATAEAIVQAAVLTAYLDRVNVKTGGLKGHLEGECSEE